MNFWLTSLPLSRARTIMPSPGFRTGPIVLDQYRYPPAAAARPGAGDAPTGEPAQIAGSSAVATVAARRPARNRALRCPRPLLSLPVILRPPSPCASVPCHRAMPHAALRYVLVLVPRRPSRTGGSLQLSRLALVTVRVAGLPV